MNTIFRVIGSKWDQRKEQNTTPKCLGLNLFNNILIGISTFCGYNVASLISIILCDLFDVR